MSEELTLKVCCQCGHPWTTGFLPCACGSVSSRLVPYSLLPKPGEPRVVCRACGHGYSRHHGERRFRHIWRPVTPEEFRRYWREKGYEKDLPVKGG